ncbi:glutathione S-transferase [Celeribacter arenosi]|uniref:Glutathione S-transferase family protein n=1 Tax=Celeribacter arenosi TaxID=792649 RepID=A0ABP7K246_9RHOB
MTYDLYIGDQTFSSWSLRGWLLFHKFDVPVRTHLVGLFNGKMAQEMEPLAPARLVPTMRTPAGEVVGESIAMLETLAEENPDAGHWPRDAAARIYARWLVAEMHSGFGALRSACPMQLLHVYDGFEVSDAVKGDLARIEELFARAFERFGGSGPWLFGDYSAADAFYAPVAARIVGYDLPVSDRLAAFAMAHLEDEAFRTWRREGAKKSYDPVPYAMDIATKPWPVAL